VGSNTDQDYNELEVFEDELMDDDYDEQGYMDDVIGAIAAAESYSAPSTPTGLTPSPSPEINPAAPSIRGSSERQQQESQASLKQQKAGGGGLTSIRTSTTPKRRPTISSYRAGESSVQIEK